MILSSTMPLIANMGTPLMWAGLFHLVIGNAIIGIGEGVLIARVFRARRWKTVLAMVAANYISMIVGVIALEWRGIPMRPFFDNATIENAGSLLAFALLVCVALSAVAEWPFCWLGLHGTEHRFGTSIKATCLAQVASYAILVPWYLSVGSISVLTRVREMPPSEFSKNQDAIVYYVDVASGDLCRIRGDGTNPETVLAADLADRRTRLYCIANSNGPDAQLIARWGRNDEEAQVLMDDFPIDSTQVCARPASAGETYGTGMSFRKTIDLQPDENEPWSVSTEFWSGEGLTAKNTASGKSLWIALETPFMAWSSRNATVLPHGQVIYQLADQIVLLDLEERKIGLLTLGRGPLVVPPRARTTIIGDDGTHR